MNLMAFVKNTNFRIRFFLFSHLHRIFIITATENKALLCFAKRGGDVLRITVPFHLYS